MNNYDELREEYKRRMSSGNKNVFLFPFVAIIMIVIGIFILNKTNEFIKNAETTMAKVYTERNTIYKESDERYYKSYAEYYVNGVKYYEPINTSKKNFSLGPFTYSDTRDGDEIVIYYNPNNPSEIMEKSTNYFGYFFIGFGILIIIALIIRIIHKILTNADIVSDKNVNENIQDKVLNFFDDEKLNKIENVQNSINISLNTIFMIILSSIGILVILFGILLLNKDASFSNNYKETTAVVSNINQTEERDANNKRYTKTHVYVQYIIDNQTYNNEIEKATGHKVNDNIIIYYNKDNPNEIRISKEMNFSGIGFIIVGIILVIVGIKKRMVGRSENLKKVDF